MASQPMMLLLERITATDKDFRYMATSDLLNELQKDTFRVDNDTERKLCTAMVNQLEDPSGDISGLAVRCLGLLARKAGEQRAQTLVTSLCDKATADTKKEAARDVASIALKTIINEVQGLPMAVPLAQIITQKMLASIKQANVDVVNDSLDVLSEVVDKVGSALTSEHVVIRDALLPFLDDARAPVRKRALQCLGFTGLYLNDEQLTGCVGPIQKRLSQGGMKADFVRTYVKALGHIRLRQRSAAA